MTVVTQKMAVITRLDGTIAVNAEVFIINGQNLKTQKTKTYYLFIFSTFVVLFLKNY